MLKWIHMTECVKGSTCLGVQGVVASRRPKSNAIFLGNISMASVQRGRTFCPRFLDLCN